jgi:hypothetical protein
MVHHTEIKDLSHYRKFLKKEFKRTGVLQHFLSLTSSLFHFQFYNAYQKGLTLKEAYEWENDEGQHRSNLTITFCNTFCENFYYDFNEYMIKMDSPIRLVKHSTLPKPKKGDKKFDFIFIIEGCSYLSEGLKHELKFSQNKNAFQGSTHGNNKVDDFILINFDIDMNRIITNDMTAKILGKVWIGITQKPKFTGKPGKKTSRSNFQFRNDLYTLEEMEEITLFGSVKLNPVNWGLVGKIIN